MPGLGYLLTRLLLLLLLLQALTLGLCLDLPRPWWRRRSRCSCRTTSSRSCYGCVLGGGREAWSSHQHCWQYNQSNQLSLIYSPLLMLPLTSTVGSTTSSYLLVRGSCWTASYGRPAVWIGHLEARSARGRVPPSHHPCQAIVMTAEKHPNSGASFDCLAQLGEGIGARSRPES